MNILFLSAFSLENTPASGAIEGSKKLFKLLEKCADKVVWKTLGQESPNLIKRIWRMLVGTTFCVPKSDCKEIEHLFLTNEFDTLFYDYAYGADFIKNFKAKFPDVKVVKFFHDVNAYRLKTIGRSYKLFSIKGNNRIKFYFYYKGVKKSEKIAVKYSDKVLCITQRDSNLIKEYYNRTADDIFPVTFDNIQIPKDTPEVYDGKNNILFVGLLSYEPNYEACKFFIDKVMPALPQCNFNVVGSKSELFKSEFEIAKNIKVYGRVDDLAAYYNDADIVVVPLFGGGGMKVKVCEAMLYAKWIYATDEAFVGYDVDFAKIGALCNTAQEFITAIKKHFDNKLPKYNDYARKQFEMNYTSESQIDKMKRILG